MPRNIKWRGKISDWKLHYLETRIKSLIWEKHIDYHFMTTSTLKITAKKLISYI